MSGGLTFCRFSLKKPWEVGGISIPSLLDLHALVQQLLLILCLFGQLRLQLRILRRSNKKPEKLDMFTHRWSSFMVYLFVFMQQKQGFLIMGIVPGNRDMTNPFFSTMAHTSPSACVSTGYHTHLSPWVTMVTKKSSPYLLIAVFFYHISARLHSQPWTVWSSCFLLVCCLVYSPSYGPID